jgi:hypothetical protein
MVVVVVDVVVVVAVAVADEITPATATATSTATTLCGYRGIRGQPGRLAARPGLLDQATKM